jgi:NAD(P)-dependent dehydrogenase (short-subunit alcohol dehydrogenase family)
MPQLQVVPDREPESLPFPRGGGVLIVGGGGHIVSRTWFVTGAARGIGAEVVKAALGAGDNVVATGRDPKNMEQAFGGGRDRLLPLELDVTREEQAPAAVEAALRQFGRIDVLVNNAGYGHLGVFEESTDDEVRKQFATNVFGLMAVTRALLPVMRKQRGGRILNISSVAGLKGGFGAALYCASKFAVEGFTQSLAPEVAPFGIQVTAVSPGYIRTDFLDPTSVRYSDAAIADYAKAVADMRAFYQNRSHNQAGDPARLAAVIVHLASIEDPPVSFVAGSDAVAMAMDVFKKGEARVEAWRNLSLSTDGDWTRSAGAGANVPTIH